MKDSYDSGLLQLSGNYRRYIRSQRKKPSLSEVLLITVRSCFTQLKLKTNHHAVFPVTILLSGTDRGHHENEPLI